MLIIYNYFIDDLKINNQDLIDSIKYVSKLLLHILKTFGNTTESLTDVKAGAAAKTELLVDRSSPSACTSTDENANRK